MSFVAQISHSAAFRSSLRRGLSTSRSLLGWKVVGGCFSDSAHRICYGQTMYSNLPIIRTFAETPEELKREKKEKRKEQLVQSKETAIRFGHKFNSMGGTRVIIAYFGLELVCWAGFYALFKAGLVSPDSIVTLMNKYEITRHFSHFIADNPNASLLTLAYAANKAISPIRMAIITGYGTYVVEKRTQALKKAKVKIQQTESKMVQKHREHKLAEEKEKEKKHNQCKKEKESQSEECKCKESEVSESTPKSL